LETQADWFAFPFVSAITTKDKSNTSSLYIYKAINIIDLFCGKIAFIYLKRLSIRKPGSQFKYSGYPRLNYSYNVFNPNRNPNPKYPMKTLEFRLRLRQEMKLLKSGGRLPHIITDNPQPGSRATPHYIDVF
jgi:hypothetical protein